MRPPQLRSGQIIRAAISMKTLCSIMLSVIALANAGRETFCSRTISRAGSAKAGLGCASIPEPGA